MMMVTTNLIVEQFINAMLLFGYYSVVAIGLTIIFGTMKIVNFAHGSFYMLGAFAVVILSLLHIPYFVAVPLAGVAIFVVGLAVERTVFRPLRGKGALSVLLATIGLFLVIRSSTRIISGAEVFYVTSPLQNHIIKIGYLNYSLSYHMIFILFSGLGILLAFYYFINHSSTGMVIRAVAEDEEVTELMGVNTDRYIQMTFAVGTALAGLAGAIVAPTIGVVYSVGLWPTMIAFIVIAIGGMGSYRGAIVGALLVALIEGMSQVFVSSQMSRILIFLFLGVMMLLKPKGIYDMDYDIDH